MKDCVWGQLGTEDSQQLMVDVFRNSRSPELPGSYEFKVGFSEF